MNESTREISTVVELDALDWEIPNVAAETDEDGYLTDDAIADIVASFEAHNNVSLEGDARRAFKSDAQDFYRSI